MKKAFPFKKRLSAVLAAVLAVAAAAGTTPASAQDETYAYSVIGDYGNFEGTLWHFSDNSSEDTLSFNAEKQPVVTKGSKSTGSEATALSYRRVTLAAGDYQLSFSLKASSQAYYIVSGYGFDSAGNAEALKYEKTAEGSVGTEWTDVTANFTVNGSYTSVEFRIILRGAAGTQITVDKLETKAFEEKQEYACVPSSAGWDGTYKTESPLANSYIEASTEGYKEPGSLHFYQYGSSDRADRNIYYTLGGLTVGKTYTLKMAVKGDTRKIDWAVAMNIELAYSNNSIWAETNSNVLTITDNYSDWQELSYDFTANNDSTQIRFNTSQYGQIDCLIDDISVCEKDSNVNLIANGGFYVPATTLNGWDGTYKTESPLANSYIEASTDGYSNPGSLHFYQYGSSERDDRNIYYTLGGLTVGKTYTLKMAVKGDTGKNDPNNAMNIELAHSNNSTWVSTGSTVLKPTDNYSAWQELSYDFTANNDSMQIRFNTSKYGQIDCLIDDISVCEKDSNVNLIANGGFYVPATTLNGWDGTYKTESPLANSYIEASTDGYSNPGSLHFYQYGSSERDDRNIYYTLGGLTVGKTYTLKMAVKGDTRKIDWAVAMNIELAYSNNSIWAETNSNVLTITDNYSDWQELSYDFTANNDSTQIRFNTSKYGQIDCLIDDISVCEKGGTTNLIANSDFCKTEKVLINENLIKNDEVKLTDIPGIDMGMLRKDGASAAAVPGGSYDGSTALKVTADGLEGYFQTYGNESETDFPDAVKRGKIAFVKGDTAVKASGYFKKLDTSDAGAEPKVWFGFGKEYTVKKFLVSKTISSIGSHYNSESDRLDTEKYEAMDNGWVKFEMSLTDDMLASSELKTSLAEAERIRFMCGVDGYDSENKKKYFGEALFDDVKFEIISKYAPGDSNGDGDIDIRDLVHMKKYAAGTVKFTDMTRGTWLSDIGYNESPSITNEMVCMRKYLIGASSEYGK